MEEDDGDSTGRRTPRKRSSKNLSHSQATATAAAVSSHSTSPKTPSLYSNVSPPHRVSQRDINGSVISSPVDDIHQRDEEVSLLSKKS